MRDATRTEPVWACGQCDVDLLVGVTGPFDGIVLQCPRCGAFNDTLPAEA